MITIYATLFLLFVLPFFVIPFGVSYFEAPKVIVAEIVIELMLFSVLLQSKTGNLLKIQKVPFLLLIVVMLVTVINLFFMRTDISFFGNQFRLQGIFLLWHLFLFSLLVKKIRFFNLPWWFFPSLAGFLLFGAVFHTTTLNGRSVGTLGEPNALAAFAVFLLPWIFFGKQRIRSIVLIAFLSMLIVIIVLSGSRSGMLAFGMEALLLVLLLKFHVSLRGVCIIGLLIVSFSYVLPSFENYRGQFERRSDVWKGAFQAGIDKPLLGWGFGNIEKAMKDTGVRYNTIIRYQYVDSSHNIFLDWWIQGGIVGVVALIGLITYAIKQFLRKNAKLELVTLLGVLVVMSFNPVSIVTLIGFWYLIGRGFNGEKSLSEHHTTS